MNTDQARVIVLKTITEVAPDVDPARVADDALLHEATGLEIPERDYPDLATVGSAVGYLVSHAA